MDNELIIKASIFERQAQDIEGNIQFISNQMAELENFSVNIAHFAESDEKEIISTLGKGVYVKGSIEDKSLLVEVGAGVVVQKSPKEIKDVVQSQISSLSDTKIRLLSQLEFYNKELSQLMHQIEQENQKESK